MATTITSNGSIFARIGRGIGQAIKETFSPAPQPQARIQGVDRYAGTPVSVASIRRNQSLIAGYGNDGPSARRGSGAPVSDAQLVSFLDELGGTGTPTRQA